MPATISYFDMEAVVTPPNGYLEPFPLTLGPNQRQNDTRILFVSGSESASGGVTEAIQLNPDPPTGYTGGYVLNPDFETRGVYYRTLVNGDSDTSVAWIKPSGWRDFVWVPITARGVDPNTAPVAGDLTANMSHSVGSTTLTVSSVTVPAAGEMIFCLWTIADPEGNWPSWPASLGVPTGWAPLVATDQSGATFYPIGVNPSIVVIGKKFGAAGSTGSVSVPIESGSHAFGGMYVFLRPAPDSTSTAGGMTAAATMGASSSSSTTNPVSVAGPMSPAKATMGQAFNGVTGYRISDPLTLPGTPVTGSVIRWTTGPPAASIAPVGSLFAANGTALTTLSVTTVSPGDVILLTTAVGSNTVTATGVSGGNAVSWTRVAAPVNDPTVVVNVDMWMGTVTAAGTANITVTYSGSITGLPCYYDAKMFTAGAAGTTWAVDQTSGADHATSLTLLYPSLTPSGQNELYYGLAWSGQTTSVAGTSFGFSYARDAIGRMACWNTNVGATVAPTASQTTTGTYISTAVLLVASPPSAPGSTVTVETSINNGASWDVATNNAQVPRLRSGDTTTLSVLTRVTMTRPSITSPSPRLTSLELQVSCDASVDEYVPIGHGVITSVKPSIGTGSSSSGGGNGVFSSGGGQTGTGLFLKVKCVDPSRSISKNPWQKPFTVNTEPYDQAVRSMVVNRLPTQEDFSVVSANRSCDLLIYGLSQSDSWQDIRDLATACGFEAFFDVAGTFTFRQVRDPRITPPVWTFTDDATCTVTQIDRELTDEQTLNYIVVKGESTSSQNPVSAFAFDNDPSSPTYVGGRFGAHGAIITIPSVTTADQAQTAANAILYASIGSCETTTITTVPIPFLEVGDCVTVSIGDVESDGRYAISQITTSWPTQTITCFRQSSQE